MTVTFLILSTVYKILYLFTWLLTRLVTSSSFKISEVMADERELNDLLQHIMWLTIAHADIPLPSHPHMAFIL